MVDPDQSLISMELARAAQAGSMEAFEELVRMFETRIFSFVYMLCGSREDALEITQDTFVKAYQAIASFNPEQPLAPWLFTIARHKTIDHCRSRKPQPTPDFVEEEDLNTPQQILSRREDAAQLWLVARKALPSLQFQVVWLKYAEELGIREIARILGCTQTYVKVLLFRARVALSAKLPEAALTPTTQLSQSQLQHRKIQHCPPVRQPFRKSETVTQE